MLGLETPFPAKFKSQIKRTSENKKIYLLEDNQIIVNGIIIVPIQEHEEAFRWSIWVSITEGEFLKNIDKDKRQIIDESKPTQATLETNIPYYSEPTSGLQVAMYLILTLLAHLQTLRLILINPRPLRIPPIKNPSHQTPHYRRHQKDHLPIVLAG